ncbi:outer membrane protein assembly factor BamD [Parachlamydia sp. AcF125]|uniref:tetratricopeptide repeat protein n=1 Tax=Parachlamydia sp. AcF125 TaxID=2795736 RepID=UPI001BC9DCD0|nr:outer membrane protein assembly factor BamD [Parachlamydia sp. AcF125]MBS4167393.1 Outer membrane protein assembly factor BamD [Parachlamydia sp. AcF125]
MKIFKCLLSAFLTLGGIANLEAGYVFKNGRFIHTQEIATQPMHVHYNLGVQAYNQENWHEAAKQFHIVTSNFSSSSWAQEALFFLGVANFQLEEFELANRAFTEYLSAHGCPEHFETAIEYKFAIAEKFREGARRHLLGTKQLPKWASGESLALQIYDEIIVAVPSLDIAAQALYSKGLYLWELKEFRESVESFQLLIRRFPKHELVPESYVAISQVYLDQSSAELQNPDILAFAEVNKRKFEKDFPGEERLLEVEANVVKIKEIYARGLFETGSFYERKGYPKAAAIYYQNTIAKFPGTQIAERCRKRLFALGACSDVKLATGKLNGTAEF